MVIDPSLLAQARTALEAGRDHEWLWTLPLLRLLGPNWRIQGLVWLRRVLARLGPLCGNEWLRWLMAAELAILLEYESAAPSREHLIEQMIFAHSNKPRFTEHLQVAWYTALYRPESNQVCIAIEYAFQGILEESGQSPEFPKLILEEFCELAEQLT